MWAAVAFAAGEARVGTSSSIRASTVFAPRWFHARVNIRGVNRIPVTPEEMAGMDYAFRLEGRKLIRIR